ncbi:MAG: NAD-glutamate dehydrogenase [Pseudomonadales bacterium]|nr:NAD-glutamate dehydrogenase [Pseudomonadales bacterium]
MEKIEQVENLSDDRILRAYIEMILATLRTNYYQLDEDGNPKEYLSLKLQPELISEAPLPKPKYEMFVYSCRVEGVHLRGGKVARGGLRWSDRSEDYRTEVLGLMKAQQVKNSVIVPLGAKGGFLPKRSMEGASREEVMAEGVYCYRMFIRGLLDVADNLVKGKVVHPERVVRYDDDDYYLVVAADKGTATFSDIANEVAESYGFWLGDAFASGGSNGYDHKQMGITAKGAWESVKRHFRDKHIDTQAEDFSVVAIGDMAGDVFGNGMLLSKHIQLVAAFNHLHIFVDPSPSAAKSYRERKRLFELERSSWADYNPRLISEGGGVFSRSAKSIAISPEMKKRFDIRESSLTPNGLISYLLKAEEDLLWNGGIGTYVKSRLESDLVVGDKANDAIRINGDELRCKVVGEGGNLGLTQLGRVEFNLNGGVCFTDFIDNAGGVNSSDAEVNIKIMLNQLMESGKLSDRSRKTLLAQMTDEVSELVLENNYRQAQAINLMQHQAVRRNFEYIRVMKGLEEHGYLNPRIEFLPTEEEVQERLTSGQALTAPELSVLTSYVKGAVKERLAEESFEDPYFLKEMYTAFPPTLVKKFGRQLEKHRLKREIIATQIANNMVNNMGMSFVSRIQETTGASRSQIASAYLAARDIFGMEDRLSEIRSLDGKVKPDIQIDMIQDLIRLVRRGTRWLLRNRRDTLDLGKDVPLFQKPLATLQRDFSAIGAGDAINEWRSGTKRLSREGVPAELAGFIAASHHLYSLMGIVEVSRLTGETTSRVASVQFAVGDQLHLHWFSKQMHEYQAASQWEALARESLQDDLNWQQVAITMAVLSEGKKRAPAERLITRWMEEHNDLVQRWLSMQAEIRSSTVRDLSIYTVAIRELMDLSQSTLGTSARIGFGT